MKVEGDKRLDKLESFLDKLHNKGTRPLFVVKSYTKHSTGSQYRISNTTNTENNQRKEIISREMVFVTLPVPSLLFFAVVTGLGVSKSKTSTIEVTTETEKEVMTLDDDETFGNFYKSVSPSSLQDSSVVLTEEDLSQIQADTPKLVHINKCFFGYFPKIILRLFA